MGIANLLLLTSNSFQAGRIDKSCGYKFTLSHCPLLTGLTERNINGETEAAPLLQTVPPYEGVMGIEQGDKKIREVHILGL